MVVPHKKPIISQLPIRPVLKLSFATVNTIVDKRSNTTLAIVVMLTPSQCDTQIASFVCPEPEMRPGLLLFIGMTINCRHWIVLSAFNHCPFNGNIENMHLLGIHTWQPRIGQLSHQLHSQAPTLSFICKGFKSLMSTNTIKTGVTTRINYTRIMLQLNLYHNNVHENVKMWVDYVGSSGSGSRVWTLQEPDVETSKNEMARPLRNNMHIYSV